MEICCRFTNLDLISVFFGQRPFSSLYLALHVLSDGCWICSSADTPPPAYQAQDPNTSPQGTMHDATTGDGQQQQQQQAMDTSHSSQHTSHPTSMGPPNATPQSGTSRQALLCLFPTNGPFRLVQIHFDSATQPFEIKGENTKGCTRN